MATYQINNHCPLPWYSVTVPFPVAVGGFPKANFIQPFDNTKEIIILNLSSVDNLLAQVDLLTPAPTSLTRATIIPPGYSITLAIGPAGYRTGMATPNSPRTFSWNLYLWTPSGNVTVDFDANITYVQGQGGGGIVAP